MKIAVTGKGSVEKTTIATLMAERTGAKVGEPAPLFTMNPKVDDMPEKYLYLPENNNPKPLFL